MMVHRSNRTRWNWLILATVAVALAGAWLSAEAGARHGAGPSVKAASTAAVSASGSPS